MAQSILVLFACCALLFAFAAACGHDDSSSSTVRTTTTISYKEDQRLSTEGWKDVGKDIEVKEITVNDIPCVIAHSEHASDYGNAIALGIDCNDDYIGQ